MGDNGSQHVAQFDFSGHVIDVYGCWDDETPENEFEFYDFFYQGECVNMGDPVYVSDCCSKDKLKETAQQFLNNLLLETPVEPPKTTKGIKT